MLISYLIGGGFWGHPDSLVFRQFIEIHYTFELERLKVNLSDLDEFKNPNQENIQETDTPIFCITEDAHNKAAQNWYKINTFLWGDNYSPETLLTGDYSRMVFDHQVPIYQNDNTIAIEAGIPA